MIDMGTYLDSNVTHERALSPADLFGGKAPVGALIGPLTGANLLAHMQLKYIFMCLCDCCELAFLSYWESNN